MVHKTLQTGLMNADIFFRPFTSSGTYMHNMKLQRANVPNFSQLILSPSDYFVSVQAKQTAKAVAGGLG